MIFMPNKWMTIFLLTYLMMLMMMMKKYFFNINNYYINYNKMKMLWY